MIGNLESNRIDEALEHVDGHWSPDSRREIRGLLERFNLADDVDAISESIRIDIERRFSEGLPITLDSYLKEFRNLQLLPEYEHAHRRLMRHCESVLRIRIRTVDYESLVFAPRIKHHLTEVIRHARRLATTPVPAH